MHTTQQEKKKKKKEVPNAGSVSSRWKKKINIKKTQMIQKMGAQERTEYVADFKAHNEQCKVWVELFNEFIKQSRHHYKESKGMIREGVAFGDSIGCLAESDGKNQIVEATLLKVAEVERQLQFQRDILFQKAASECVDRIETFVREDIAVARKAKSSFRDARIQFDASNFQLQGVVAKADKPMDLFLAYTHYHYAKRKYDRRLVDASNKLSDTIEKKEFELLECFVNMMYTLLNFYSLSYELLYHLGPYQNELSDWIKLRREQASNLRKKREEKKEQQRRKEEQDKYRPLVKLLAAPDLALVSAICHSAGEEQGATLETLIKILDAYKLTLPIIRLGITKEVESTNAEAQLFRANTTATKLMGSFTKMTGHPLLVQTIQPIITAVLDAKLSYEVNPDKVGSGEDVNANMEKLLDTCEKILNIIVKHVADCPPPFRAMANHLRKECVAKFPDMSGYKAVGGFIFLRFFCPAILAPESHGLVPGVKELDPNARRPLVLISKCIQNLSNEVVFGAKEAFMLPVNTFIEKNIEKLHAYFDEITTVPQNLMEYTPLASMEHVNSHELPAIHAHVMKNLEKIALYLKTHEHTEAVPLLAHILAQLDANFTDSNT